MSRSWTGLIGRAVLVVDDHDDSRQLLRMMLTAHGASVFTAASVATARLALAEQLPDVLITDLAMPIEDGYGLLDYCRQHPDARLQTLPIVALTGYGNQQAAERVLAAGFDAFVAKPVEPLEIGRIVSDLLRRRDGAP